MSMLADEIDWVIGVDTHRDRHALGVVDPTGGLRHELAIDACAQGYEQALGMAHQLAPGRRVWAIEGAGSYGAGLARHLMQAGERVVEIERPVRQRRPGGGKSDPLDAVRAAREALARGELATPRQGTEREALRLLLATRALAVTGRTAAISQVKAFIVSAPDDLRAELRVLTTQAQLRRLAALRPHHGQAVDRRAIGIALRFAARRALALDEEARALEAEIRAVVERLAPELLGVQGVGPIVAAQLLVSYSHPGRFRSEAAFASLAGVAPIPASSGLVVRHRLNRGGDRQLNRAIRVVVLTRTRHREKTRAYMARRRAEGRSTRETMRCLMRHVARGLFRLLTWIMSGQRPRNPTSTRAVTPATQTPGQMQPAAEIVARLVSGLHLAEAPSPT
jgi:transposase